MDKDASCSVSKGLKGYQKGMCPSGPFPGFSVAGMLFESLGSMRTLGGLFRACGEVAVYSKTCLGIAGDWGFWSLV